MLFAFLYMCCAFFFIHLSMKNQIDIAIVGTARRGGELVLVVGDQIHLQP